MKRFLFSTGFLSILLAGSLALGAQNPPPGKAAPPAPASASGGSTGSSAPSQQTGNQSGAQTEEKDENAVYRHSASVRAVSGWLHLDMETTARIFESLNFSILAGAILFFAWKYLPKALRARRESIQKNLAEARAATEQANTRLKAVEQRFARLDEEIAGIRAQAEQEGLVEEARIKALIETERQRIVASAEQEIAAAAASARRELKRLAAELAVNRAEQMISLSENGDRVLVRQFSRELTREARNGERN